MGIHRWLANRHSFLSLFPWPSPLNIFNPSFFSNWKWPSEILLANETYVELCCWVSGDVFAFPDDLVFDWCHLSSGTLPLLWMWAWVWESHHSSLTLRRRENCRDANTDNTLTIDSMPAKTRYRLLWCRKKKPLFEFKFFYYIKLHTFLPVQRRIAQIPGSR